MHFQNFRFILLLFALPFLYRFAVAKKPASLPHPDLLGKLKGRLPNLRIRTRLPLYLRLAVLILLILALMRPQQGYVADTSSRNGADIMVALDVSSSMNAEDLKPNRITAARMSCPIYRRPPSGSRRPGGICREQLSSMSVDHGSQYGFELYR